MNKLIYQKKYTYTVMNRTCFDEIAPWCVLDIFQDVSSEHVEEYNLGFDGMLSKGLIWVLVRTKYQVINDPKPSNKELYVTTWQSEQARAEFTRDYIIKDNTDAIYQLLLEPNIDDMISMNGSLALLVERGFITKEEALLATNDKNELETILRGAYQGSKSYYE